MLANHTHLHLQFHFLMYFENFVNSWNTMMFEVYSDNNYDRDSGLLNFSYGGFQGMYIISFDVHFILSNNVECKVEKEHQEVQNGILKMCMKN